MGRTKRKSVAKDHSTNSDQTKRPRRSVGELLPFECKICPYCHVLRPKRNFSRHQCVKIACPIPGCKSTSTRQDNLNRHLKTKHGCGPYVKLISNAESGDNFEDQEEFAVDSKGFVEIGSVSHSQSSNIDLLENTIQENQDGEQTVDIQENGQEAVDESRQQDDHVPLDAIIPPSLVPQFLSLQIAVGKSLDLKIKLCTGPGTWVFLGKELESFENVEVISTESLTNLRINGVTCSQTGLYTFTTRTMILKLILVVVGENLLPTPKATKYSTRQESEKCTDKVHETQTGQATQEIADKDNDDANNLDSDMVDQKTEIYNQCDVISQNKFTQPNLQCALLSEPQQEKEEEQENMPSQNSDNKVSQQTLNFTTSDDPMDESADHALSEEMVVRDCMKHILDSLENSCDLFFERVINSPNAKYVTEELDCPEIADDAELLSQTDFTNVEEPTKFGDVENDKIVVLDIHSMGENLLDETPRSVIKNPKDLIRYRPKRAVQGIPETNSPPILDASVFLKNFIPYVLSGQQLSLSVPFTALPLPEINWTINGEKAIQSNRLSILTTDTDSNLTIFNSSRSDTGTYSLNAQNTLGTDSVSIKITVVSEPQPPSNFRVIRVGTNFCDLAWDPPLDNGGMSVILYQLSTLNAETKEWDIVKNIPDQKFTYSNLEQGATYTVGICSCTATSSSTYSKVTFLTNDPVIVPGEPTEVKVEREGSLNSWSLSWFPPKSDGGAPILYWIIDKWEADGAGLRLVLVGKFLFESVWADGRHRCPLLKFQEGKRNSFLVKAVNRKGASRHSLPTKQYGWNYKVEQCFRPRSQIPQVNSNSAGISSLDYQDKVSDPSVSSSYEHSLIAKKITASLLILKYNLLNQFPTKQLSFNKVAKHTPNNLIFKDNLLDSTTENWGSKKLIVIDAKSIGKLNCQKTANAIPPNAIDCNHIIEVCKIFLSHGHQVTIIFARSEFKCLMPSEKKDLLTFAESNPFINNINDTLAEDEDDDFNVLYYAIKHNGLIVSNNNYYNFGYREHVSLLCFLIKSCVNIGIDHSKAITVYQYPYSKDWRQKIKIPKLSKFMHSEKEYRYFRSLHNLSLEESNSIWNELIHKHKFPLELGKGYEKKIIRK